MPSSAKTLVTFEIWNRKLHFYLGLYLLSFLWLFSLTGLLLNHGQWSIAQAANQRRETRYEQAIQAPVGDSDLARARAVMRQLKLVGEIDWPSARQQAGRLDFNVNRPKDASQVRVDLAQNRATIQHFDNGGWAIFRIFHTFSGSRFNAPDQPDWIVTTVWVIAMDGLAAGLILMALGSYYMWYRFKRERLQLGVLILGAGWVSCALFLRFVWS
jgi:hypothetical protein